MAGKRRVASKTLVLGGYGNFGLSRVCGDAGGALFDGGEAGGLKRNLVIHIVKTSTNFFRSRWCDSRFMQRKFILVG